MINYQKLLHKNQQNTIHEEQHTIIFNWMLGRQPTRLSPCRLLISPPAPREAQAKTAYACYGL